jgi:hypothetical protein
MAVKSISLTEPVKLVYVPEKRDVVVFRNGLQGRAEFSPDYRHLEVAMKKIGLSVPYGEEKNYPSLKKDQRRIQLNDPGFGIAFYELYWHRTMNLDEFHWQPIKKG